MLRVCDLGKRKTVHGGVETCLVGQDDPQFLVCLAGLIPLSGPQCGLRDRDSLGLLSGGNSAQNAKTPG